LTIAPVPMTAVAPRVSLLGPWSQRSASLISGAGLTGMAILMPAGYYGAIVPLVVPGDDVATAHNIAASPIVYLVGLVAIAVVIALDAVVSVAWYWLFRSVNPRVSAVAAWLRVVYSIVFAVAAAQLMVAFVQRDEPVRAVEALDAFNAMWLSSLGLFGVHLIVIGYLAIRAAFIAPIFGVLLVMSGIGYIVDAVGVVFDLQLPVAFGSFGFVGEVAIIVWLFVRGRRLTG